MATSNNRDVRLGIEIETAGEESVKRLAAAVRALGKEGDPAAAEFNRLADELDRLSQQAGAVQAIEALQANVTRLAAAERDAALAAQATSAKFTEQASAADVLRAAQDRATSELVQAKSALAEFRAELERQVVAGKVAGDSQKELAARTEDARLSLIGQKLAVTERTAALASATTAVDVAAKAEGKLRREMEATSAAAKSTLTALQTQTATLTAAEAAAQAFGVDIENLADAQDAFRERLGRTSAEVNQFQSRAQSAADYTRFWANSLDALDAAAAESAAAMALLERASREADATVERLAATLRETESAARGYTAATEAAAAAGADDARATAARVRAAETLIQSERELTVAQRTLATERDRSRTSLVAEAQALLASARAAEASSRATAELVRNSTALGTALDGTGRSIARVGTLTEEAFGKTGVRSLQAIEAEISDVDRAMSLLQRRFQSGQISATDLARAVSSAQVRLATLKREAETFPGMASQFERINSSITSVVSKFGALGAAIATVGVAVKPVLDATIALEQIRRTLTQVTGSAETAEQQIAFLRKTSQESGQSFTEVGQSYAKFAASALQSGLTINQTQEVFKSVSLAAGNLGLSTDQAKRALEALSQIASKGTVSMEELRQQLGDALPGVLPLLAKELGLTQAELNKVVESGQLLAQEAIPAIGRSLTKLQPANGQVEGMVASWNRFKNVVLEAGTAIVDGPLGQGVGVVVTSIAGVLRDLAVVTVSASSAVKFLGQTVGATAAFLAGGARDFDSYKATISGFAEKAGADINAFKETAYGAGAGVKALGTDLAALGASFARLALDQQKAIDSAVLAAQSSEKNVAAKKAEGEAAITLAGLIGDEATARRVAAEVALQSVAAAEKQAAADLAVVAALTAAKAATEAKALADGLGRDSIKATVEALDIKIAKAQADVEKTNGQADAARAHAAALELSSEKLLDNSKRIGEFRAAVADAEAALQDKIRAMRLDRATSAEVEKAATALAKAKGLLRDAINDVSEALERQLAALRADSAYKVASLKLDLELARTAERKAIAQGNETQARLESIRIKQLEQQIDSAGISLKLQEAEAALRALDVQEKELKLLGQLTPERQAEIDLKRKTAETSVLEAAANKEASKERDEEIKRLREGSGERTGYNASVDGSVGALDRETGALSRNTAARSAASKVPVGGGGGSSGGGGSGGGSGPRKGFDAYGRPLNTLAQDAGSIDNGNDEKIARILADEKAGRDAVNSTVADNTGPQALLDKIRAGTLTEADRGLVEGVFNAYKGNVRIGQTSRPGAISLDGRSEDARIFNAARVALDKLNSQGTPVLTESGARNATRLENSAPREVGIRTVNVVINGKSQAVRVASDADGAALVALIQQLGEASNRANP